MSGWRLYIHLLQAALTFHIAGTSNIAGIITRTGMTIASLRQGGREAIGRLLQQTAASKRFPAVFFLATNAKETIYEDQAGERILGDGAAGQVNPDTVMELFSQTKVITAISALQLVDQGLVSLDSEEDVAKHLPEVGKLNLLVGYGADGQPLFEKPKTKITLRMLMSHTAGLSYNTYFSSPLDQYFKLHPEDTNVRASTASISTCCKALHFEPGSSWHYALGMDLTGKLIERVSGERLDQYFQNHIFDPLGVNSLTFFPTDEVKRNKMTMCLRMGDGPLVHMPTGFGPSRPESAKDVSTAMLSGGAGLYGTQRDFLKVLRAILQADPTSAHPAESPIISPASFKELFQGVVDTDAGRQGLINHVTSQGYFNPPARLDNIDHSVGFLLNTEDFTGRRKKGSGTWYGGANTQFWIDPTTGIAGICATQLFTSTPKVWYDVYVAFEEDLYSQLA